MAGKAVPPALLPVVFRGPGASCWRGQLGVGFGGPQAAVNAAVQPVFQGQLAGRCR